MAVADLSRRWDLPSASAATLRDLAETVISDPAAPTTIRDPAHVVADHLADSLVALALPEVLEAQRIADLGSGPGFPGLALAVALPSARVDLVESSSRKCAFLRRAITRCGIANACVVEQRVEAWNGGLGSCDLVTARALAPADVVAEYAAPLLRLRGTLVIWQGRRDQQAEQAAARAAARLGLEAAAPLPVSPYDGALHRHLQLMRKVSETPPGFPRRPGMARKRPLGTV